MLVTLATFAYFLGMGALLPTLPAFDLLEVAWRYRPVGGHAMGGGDWYDAVELAAIIAALTAAGAPDVWGGVMRDAPQPWVWRVVTGGSASYLPWETGQPDNQSGDQQVVSLMRASGLIRDVSTGSSTDRAALCECDRRPPTNADYTP